MAAYDPRTYMYDPRQITYKASCERSTLTIANVQNNEDLYQKLEQLYGFDIEISAGGVPVSRDGNQIYEFAGKGAHFVRVPRVSIDIYGGMTEAEIYRVLRNAVVPVNETLLSVQSKDHVFFDSGQIVIHAEDFPLFVELTAFSTAVVPALPHEIALHVRGGMTERNIYQTIALRAALHTNLALQSVLSMNGTLSAESDAFVYEKDFPLLIDCTISLPQGPKGGRRKKQGRRHRSKTSRKHGSRSAARRRSNTSRKHESKSAARRRSNTSRRHGSKSAARRRSNSSKRRGR